MQLRERLVDFDLDFFKKDLLKIFLGGTVEPWCIGYLYWTSSFNEV